MDERFRKSSTPTSSAKRRELVRVEAEEVHVVQGGAGHVELQGMLLTARRPPVRDRREGDLRTLEPTTELPRDLTESGLGFEETDEIDAWRRVVRDVDHRRSRDQSSSGRTTPRH